MLRALFSDAQCGFKAIRADVAHELLQVVRDDGWFFDTELLIAAQRRRLRIHEVAVDWTDDPDSRVDIVPTALADLRGVARLLVSRDVALTTLFSHEMASRMRRSTGLRRPGRVRQRAPSGEA